MEDFDIVIVGAGIAGAIAADALAGKGHRVLVLEAGPDEQDRSRLTETYFGAPQKGFDSPYRNPATAPKPTAAPAATRPDATPPTAICGRSDRCTRVTPHHRFASNVTCRSQSRPATSSQREARRCGAKSATRTI